MINSLRSLGLKPSQQLTHTRISNASDERNESQRSFAKRKQKLFGSKGKTAADRIADASEAKDKRSKVMQLSLKAALEKLRQTNASNKDDLIRSTQAFISQHSETNTLQSVYDAGDDLVKLSVDAIANAILKNK